MILTQNSNCSASVPNPQLFPMKGQRVKKKRNQDFVQRSSLYQEFLAEREEILKHKWLESEKAGYDIGFERALLDWIRNHRESWRAKRRLNAK